MTRPRIEIGVVDADAGADDELALGGPRRPPGLRPVLVGVAALLVLAGVVVATHRGSATSTDASPTVARTTAGPTSAAPSGPTLVQVDGAAALSVPVGPTSGGLQTTDVRTLVAAPDAVAAVTAALPGWRGTTALTGGRVAGPWSRYGLYLTGALVGPNGEKTTLTLYTMQAPGTTYGTDHLTTEKLFDQGYTLQTEVTVFTGTGWWVHVLAVGSYANPPGDMVGTLTTLAGDPRLTAS